ncbi:ribosomal RNA small subunit methyltransferase G [Spirochaetia bacterium]|nr:ribosomal RNA small subunit methyltransferase G [Spirochaetia bacterium]
MHDVLNDGLIQLCHDDSDTARVLEPRFDEAVSLLNRYIAEIELFNPAYGLVKVIDRRELIIKHILDSLAPLGIIVRLLDRFQAKGGSVLSSCSNTAAPLRIADVGSGAGLPGIPLAIALPGVNFTLIERMGRRAGFLRNTQALLGLANLEVEEAEMEKAEAARFDLITFRAFRPLDPPILRGLSRLLRTGGLLAAYKGRRDAIEAELAAIGGAHSGSSEIIPCPVPFLAEERHLVVMAV